MQDYSGNLRSFTQGRAKFRLHFIDYEAVPFEIQRKLADEYNKVAKEELVA
jgi:elongation factor G